MKPRWVIAGAAALSLALLTLPLWRGRTGGEAIPGRSAAGGAGPAREGSCDAQGTAKFDFVLKDQHNVPVKMADYKGKVVLLDFWATWCGPCKVEIPAFIDLYTKYKPQGFEVVSVVLLDRFINAKPFAQKMKMNYPVLDGDPQQDKIDDAYGPLFGLPMSFLISRDGRVCHKHLGLPAMKDGKEPDEKT